LDNRIFAGLAFVATAVGGALFVKRSKSKQGEGIEESAKE
jgi:hypothetical protein